MSLSLQVPLGVSLGVSLVSLSLRVPLSQLTPQAFSSLNKGWGEATYSQKPGGRSGGGTSAAPEPTLPTGRKGSARSLPRTRAGWR